MAAVVQVISWNVNVRARTEEAAGRASVLLGVEPRADVILLQEVRRGDVSRLLDRAGGLLGAAFCSVDVDERVSGRKVGTAVLVPAGWKTGTVSRLPVDACFQGDMIEGNPFKAVMVDVEVPLPENSSKTLTFISAHVPPATRLKNRKPAFASALARWVAECEHPVVMGIDANAPAVDHPDDNKIVVGWDSQKGIDGPGGWVRHELDPWHRDPGGPDAWGEDGSAAASVDGGCAGQAAA